MTSTVDQPTTSTLSVPVDLPGRAVDVVHAAILAAGEHPSSINTSFGYDGTIEITTHLRIGSSARSEAAGRRIFAALGVTDPTLTGVYGVQQIADLTATVPALGGQRLIVVVHGTEPTPEPGDVDALVADVDARRAADQNPATPATPATTAATATGSAGREQAPTTAAGPTVAALSGKAVRGLAGSGERAVRFWARFDSTCPACGEQLAEGEPASWLDGEVVHDTCAQAAGIDVFDPR